MKCSSGRSASSLLFAIQSLSVLLLYHLLILTLAARATDSALQFPNTNHYTSVAQQQQFAVPVETTTVMRAWTCHGRTQREMVDRLRQAGIIRSDAVHAVMVQTDRQHYVPTTTTTTASSSSGFVAAYQDSPLSIGLGQTISAPHMHAHVLEEIYPYVKKKQPNQQQQQRRDEAEEPVKFLDVGCGSGYLTACFGRWLQPRDGGSSILGRTGHVYGIDIFPHLVALSAANMKKGDADLLGTTVTLQTANGWEGLPDAAPFDAIHVGAAAAEFPQTLAQQLKVGGVLIVPIGSQLGSQALYKVERVGGSGGAVTFDAKDYSVTELLGVRYVPLIEQPPAS